MESPAGPPPEPAPADRTAGPGTGRGSRPERPRKRAILFGGAGLLLAGLLVAVLLASGPGGSPPSTPSLGALPGGGLPGITPATANLLSLTLNSSANPILAKDFSLTDQQGHRVSLARFRGKSVVLSFNDDRCTDVCTLLAQDIVRADRYLGPAGRKRVVFLSVNVNPFYPQVRYVRQWSDQHDLGGLGNWYFSTGSVPTLEAVWKAYGIYVKPDPRTRTVEHGAVIELISPTGRLEGGADFGQTAVDVAPYAHGLAQAAMDLLPGSERTPVAGPQATASGGPGAQLTEQAPAFRLPLLGDPRHRVDLARFRGHPVVINFWASSCVACRAELAAFARVAKEVPKVRFVGVDVADPSVAAAGALARRAAVAYPVGVDSSGRVAASYTVSDLPTTLFLDSAGKVAVRHPGTLTAENLFYALGQYFPNDVPGASP